MERKTLIITLVIAIIIILAILLFTFYTPKLSPSSALDCEEFLVDNDPDIATNVVFLTDNIEKSTLSRYTDSLFSFEPFTNHKDKFNFYYAGEYNDCKLQSSAILCHSRNLIKKASICPNEFIIVVSSQAANVRSSTYQNVLSVNSALKPNVFVHEFGHAFANLADEYIPANLPKGQQNCKATCEEFSSSLGCFDGCSKAELKRSSQASIMRTLKASSFDELNEDILNERIKGIQ